MDDSGRAEPSRRGDEIQRGREGGGSSGLSACALAAALSMSIQEPVQFGVDLALNGWEQADIDKVELIELVDGADRLGAVDGLGISSPGDSL